jgi:hypothetical protein
MTDAIRADHQRTMLIKRIECMTLPFSVSLAKGAPRSIDQNRLQRKWLKEAEEQSDLTAEEWRGYCKLHFGIAIAKENEAYAEKYDRLIRPLPYHTKLEFMMEPLNFPVTSIMSTEQKTRYLNAIFTHLASQGIVLTEPNNG